jgi:hypothetical protein
MADNIKSSNLIPLDFVPGTHGHFLEYLLNRGIGVADTDFSPFTNIGTSHQRPKSYLDQRIVIAKHWSHDSPEELKSHARVIRIVFDTDDLLLVNSLCWKRAADRNLDNNELHINTVDKLNNKYYSNVLEEIFQAYPFLDKNSQHIPRYVLREFFKFGFADPEINGLWKKLSTMLELQIKNEIRIDLKSFYNFDRLLSVLNKLQTWLNRSFDFGEWLRPLHDEFVSKIPFLDEKNICDQILADIQDQNHSMIPSLSLFQESYINGNLERIYRKEMPFCQHDYFKNTKDVLEYIKTAPDL